MKLDITSGRKESNYTRSEKIQRLCWSVASLAFRMSPRLAFSFRVWLLRKFGASIGINVHIYPTVRVFMPSLLTIGDNSAVGAYANLYNLGPITLGHSVTISQGAHICAGTHDYSSPTMTLQRQPISIEDQVWICADAFVGPNTIISAGCVVGARAVVMRDFPEWSIIAGNPARIIAKRDIRPHAN